MADERRYQEDEVAQIFESAASPQATADNAVATGRGLTLAELQEIGREVGVAPERIAEAAAAMDVRHETQPRRAYLGIPVAVGRTVDLPRALTEREWELLLVDLRTTFGARGRELSRGTMREWTNGNLHAFVEPTVAGYRLRLGTRKGIAGPLMIGGAVALAGGLLSVVQLAVPGLAFEAGEPGTLITLGAAALAYGGLTLPRWAARREQQMEYITARARELIRAAAE